jgi:branched-chain amino acid transport system substrate-binding protein
MFTSMIRPLLYGLALFALLVAGCEKPAPSPTQKEPEGKPTPIKSLDIGVFLPFKGEAVISAQDALNGLQLAAEQCNAAGGVNGRPVRLIVRDTDSDPASSKKAMQDLVVEDKVIAVIGALSTGSGEAVAEANVLKIPLIAIGSTMPARLTSEPWVSRICYADFHSGHIMAQTAFTLGALRAIILFDREDKYAQSLALSFSKKFKTKKHTVMVAEYFSIKSLDFTKQLENIKKKNPDIVYLPHDHRTAAAILKQARAMGLAMPFLGTAMWDSPEFLAATGEAANGCYLPGRYNPQSDAEKVLLFAPAYTQKFGSSPTAPSALGYEALIVLTTAIQKAGSIQPNAIQSAIRKTTNLPGLTGLITVDPERIMVFSVPVLKVEEGKFKYLETETMK